MQKHLKSKWAFRFCQNVTDYHFRRETPQKASQCEPCSAEINVWLKTRTEPNRDFLLLFLEILIGSVPKLFAPLLSVPDLAVILY